MIQFRKTYEVIGFTYDADIHCMDCAYERFGSIVYSLDQSNTIDSEGNPIHPIFLGDDFDSYPHCGDCFEPLNYGDDDFAYDETEDLEEYL